MFQLLLKLLCCFISLQLDDKVTCHKARVSSTLDRLAEQVALEKKERANKCRAFKVRLPQFQAVVFTLCLQFLCI